MQATNQITDNNVLTPPAKNVTDGIYLEPQRVLLCGKHALNNLLQEVKFVWNYAEDTPPQQINILKKCKEYENLPNTAGQDRNAASCSINGSITSGIVAGDGNIPLDMITILLDELRYSYISQTINPPNQEIIQKKTLAINKISEEYSKYINAKRKSTFVYPTNYNHDLFIIVDYIVNTFNADMKDIPIKYSQLQSNDIDNCIIEFGLSPYIKKNPPAAVDLLPYISIYFKLLKDANTTNYLHEAMINIDNVSRRIDYALKLPNLLGIIVYINTNHYVTILDGKPYKKQGYIWLDSQEKTNTDINESFIINLANSKKPITLTYVYSTNYSYESRSFKKIDEYNINNQIANLENQNQNEPSNQQPIIGNATVNKKKYNVSLTQYIVGQSNTQITYYDSNNQRYNVNVN